jgi:galactose mutarotase-like enzyme
LPGVFTLEDSHGLRLQGMDLGATWLSSQVPLAGGTLREVLPGHPQPQDHLHEPGYLGGIVGRFANRIARATRTPALRTRCWPVRVRTCCMGAYTASTDFVG